MQHWSEKYIGIPYSHANCAELVAQVLAKQFGRHEAAFSIIALNGNAGSNFMEQWNIAKAAKNLAVEIGGGEVEDGDLVLLESRNALHIGIFTILNLARCVLHTSKETGAILQRLVDVEKTYRVKGFYRIKNV